MNGICRSALASFGPTWVTVAAELGGGLVDAGLRGGEVLVDDVLRQVADVRPAAAGRGRCRGADGAAVAPRRRGGSGRLTSRRSSTRRTTSAATLMRAIDPPDRS